MRANLRGSHVARRRIVMAVLGATLLGAVILPAIAAANDPSVEEQIQALDQEYEERASAIPEGPARGPALTALNEEYEKDFAKIAPATPPSVTDWPNPEDDVPNLVPQGIHDAVEYPPGYVLTNYWATILDGGGTLFVAGAAEEADPKVGGVYVADDRGVTFFPSPEPVGALTVTSVEDMTVSLVSDSGVHVTFDAAARRYS